MRKERRFPIKVSNRPWYHPISKKTVVKSWWQMASAGFQGREFHRIGWKLSVDEKNQVEQEASHRARKGNIVITPSPSRHREQILTGNKDLGRKTFSSCCSRRKLPDNNPASQLTLRILSMKSLFTVLQGTFGSGEKRIPGDLEEQAHGDMAEASMHMSMSLSQGSSTARPRSESFCQLAVREK